MEEVSQNPQDAGLSAKAEAAQKAMLDRPRVSIRTRLIFAVVAWFLLTLGLAITSVATLSNMAGKLRFTEAVDRYTFEVQQARRFEKNFFLYQTNLPDALDHSHNAQAVLDRERANIEAVIGASGFESMSLNLERYEALLSRLQALEQVSGAPREAEYRDAETGLRELGAVMVAEAEELVRREREAVEAMILLSQRIPLAILVILVGVILYTAVIFRENILAPLDRIMRVTQRVANGDFTPIQPVRKYHDEFSHLAVAMNTMMTQLQHRHRLLVQAHKLKAVGTLTAGVAHELNNPINNLMLTASGLQEDYGELSDPDRLDMVNDMVSQSERAQRIVRNLLDFARESAFETEALAPQHLIVEVLQLASNQVKHSRVKVTGEVEENLPQIHGDAQGLSQVILNIVLNALDAMPSGGTLNISLKADRAKGLVTFEFSDTGTGIPQHVIENIFDPFFTTKPGAKGTGLGLSVSLGIVRQHGGDIHVESTPGKGTTFTISLPVAMVPAEQPDDPMDDEDEDEVLIG